MEVAWAGIMAGLLLWAQVPVKLPMGASGRVQYEDWGEAEGATARELLSRARSWARDRLASTATECDQNAERCLLAKGSFRVARPKGPPAVAAYELAIAFEDGRYRVLLGAIEVVEGSPSGPIERSLRADGAPLGNVWLVESVDRQARLVLADLREALTGRLSAREHPP
jgi:hypothetical protein